MNVDMHKTQLRVVKGQYLGGHSFLPLTSTWISGLTLRLQELCGFYLLGSLTGPINMFL